MEVTQCSIDITTKNGVRNTGLLGVVNADSLIVKNCYVNMNIDVTTFTSYSPMFAGITYQTNMRNPKEQALIENCLVVMNNIGSGNGGKTITANPFSNNTYYSSGDPINVVNSYYNANDTLVNDTYMTNYARTVEQLKISSTFVGWDFESVWDIEEGTSYPVLRDNSFGNVDNKDSDIEPEFAEDDFESDMECHINKLSADDIVYDATEDIEYVKDELLIIVANGITKDDMASLLAEYDGYVVGYMQLTNIIQAKFRNIDELNDLKNIISDLSNNNWIIYSCINPVFLTDPENRNFGIVWDESNPMGDNWGLETIKVRDAWNLLNSSSIDKNIKTNVGIIDDMFFPTEDISHMTLLDNTPPLEDKYKTSKFHGTRVATVLGGKRNSMSGIPGTATANKFYNISYSFNDAEINTYALYSAPVINLMFMYTKLFERDVKIINQSFPNARVKKTIIIDDETLTEDEEKENLYDHRYIHMLSPDERRIYDRKVSEMIKLIDEPLKAFLLNEIINNREFLVVQAAGNSPVDTTAIAFNGVTITDNRIRDRMIVVGSVTNQAYSGDSSETATFSNYKLSDFSAIGSRVDIIAPGKDIYVPGAYNKSTDSLFYGNTFGTSFSAPYVSGVASMVWQANPNLSGAEVKKILVETGSSVVSKDLKSDIKDPISGKTYPILNAKNAVEESMKQYKKSNRITGKVSGELPFENFPTLSEATVTYFIINNRTKTYSKGRTFITTENGYYTLPVKELSRDEECWVLVSKEADTSYGTNNSLKPQYFKAHFDYSNVSSRDVKLTNTANFETDGASHCLYYYDFYYSLLEDTIRMGRTVEIASYKDYGETIRGLYVIGDSRFVIPIFNDDNHYYNFIFTNVKTSNTSYSGDNFINPLSLKSTYIMSHATYKSRYLTGTSDIDCDVTVSIISSSGKTNISGGSISGMTSLGVMENNVRYIVPIAEYLGYAERIDITYTPKDKSYSAKTISFSIESLGEEKIISKNIKFKS